MLYYSFMFLAQFYSIMEDMIQEFFLLPKLSANEILVHLKMYFLRLSQAIDGKLRPIAPVICILFFPLTVVYYCFIVIPYSICCFAYENLKAIVDIVTRRSKYTRRLIMHMVALREIFSSICRYVVDTKLSDLVHVIIESILEVIYEFVMSWDVSKKNDQDEGVAMKRKGLSYTELAELLDYKERDEDNLSEAELKERNRRMKKMMHRPFPANLFKAIVRLPSRTSTSFAEPASATPCAGSNTPVRTSSIDDSDRVSSSGAAYRHWSDILQSKYAEVVSRNGTAAEGSMASVSFASNITSEDMVESYRQKGNMIVSQLGNVASDLIATTAENAKGTKLEPLLQVVKNRSDSMSKTKSISNSVEEKDESDDLFCETPYSFPPTPFARNRAINASNQKVASMMFCVRDLLRIEEQSASRDAVCRKAAERAKDTGQLAIFDAKHASEGLALFCGQHCAMKIGGGTCCSCRATVPLLRDCYVYMEYSITVSGAQIPWLAVGLVSPDTPLSMMVGSSNHSIALNSDGHLLVGSRWFHSNDAVTMLLPGTTVGVLVYLEGTYEDNSVNFGNCVYGDEIGLNDSMASSGSDCKDSKRESVSDMVSNSSNVSNASYMHNGSSNMEYVTSKTGPARSSELNVANSQSTMGTSLPSACFLPIEGKKNSDLNGVHVSLINSQSKAIGNGSSVPKTCSKSDHIYRSLSVPNPQLKHRSCPCSEHKGSNSSFKQHARPNANTIHGSFVNLYLSVMNWVVLLIDTMCELIVMYLIGPIETIEDSYHSFFCGSTNGSNAYHGGSCVLKSIVMYIRKFIIVHILGIPLSSSKSVLLGVLGGVASISSSSTSLYAHDIGGIKAMKRKSISGNSITMLNHGEHLGTHSANGWHIGGTPTNIEEDYNPSTESLHEEAFGGLEICFNVNGRVKTFDDEHACFKAIDGLALSSYDEVFPSISVLSDNTRVWNRYCQSDIVFRRRDQIGAPPGVKVYCVDGSLLLSEND